MIDSHSVCFETFPFPQTPIPNLIVIDDLLEKLLTLNLELAEKEKRGEAIVSPWAPTQ
jgi:hypothetical protein